MITGGAGAEHTHPHWTPGRRCIPDRWSWSGRPLPLSARPLAAPLLFNTQQTAPGLSVQNTYYIKAKPGHIYLPQMNSSTREAEIN